MDDVATRVFSIIGRTFGCDPASLTRATQAEDVVGWDSLSHTVLIVSIERQLDVRLDHGEVLDLEDVGGLIDAVERGLSAKSMAGA